MPLSLSSSSSALSEDTQMAHSQGHICHCLSHIRRASPLTIAGRRVRTGRDFADGVLSLSRGLSHLGIRPGDVVAIAALNSDFYMEWLLAITCVGAIAAPLNYRWSFEEAKSAMEVVTPVMLVVDESCRSWALALQNCNVVRSLRLYAFIGDSSFHGLNGSGEFLTMESLRMPAPGLIVHEPIYTPKGIALICFTSGTTGRPKGVAISHTALIVQALAKIAIVGYGESDVYLHTAPLCHIGGISSCIAMLFTAACHVFMPKFDAKSSFLAIQENQVTSLIVVPAMLSDLISFARNANKMVTGVTVRKILNGGGGLSSTLINLATHIFPHTKIFSAYGLTETCSSLTFMTLNDPTLEESGISQHSNHKMNNEQSGVLVGKPAPHVELRIKCDSESSGSPLTGSILTRGLHVMVGYFQKMDVKMEFVGKGWFDTGDIGWIDGNGGLWLVGRDKDRIKSGGENVYAEEVEAVLSQHPGILHVVVVGIPDMRLGEKLVACVFIRKDWKWVDKKIHHFQEAKELSSEILHTYCRQKNLTGFKIPKIFLPWRTPFPLTTTGKLKREDVKAEVISCMKLTSSL